MTIVLFFECFTIDDKKHQKKTPSIPKLSDMDGYEFIDTQHYAVLDSSVFTSFHIRKINH